MYKFTIIPCDGGETLPKLYSYIIYHSDDVQNSIELIT